MALVAGLGFIAGSIALGLLSFATVGDGIGDLLRQQLNNIFQAKLPDVIQQIQSRNKKLITKNEYEQNMKYLGFSSKYSELIYNSTLQGLSPNEALSLYFRSLAESQGLDTNADLQSLSGNDLAKKDQVNPFNISKEWLQNRLQEQGINTDFLDEFILANRPTPSFQDISTFAARDVFEPEQVKLGRLDEGLNQTIIDQFLKTGATRELAQYVWRAHWVVPSLNQMIEMRQRLFDHQNPDVKFDDRAMDLAFKIADLAPGFRERIKAITFTPLGRVDIRRADALGLYGEDEEREQKLIRAYQEIGYNEKDASFQKDFTVALNQEENRNLSKTEILRFYREGVYGDDRRSIATDLLSEIGYSKSEIDYLLNFEEMKEIDQEEKGGIENLLKEYLMGNIKTDTEIQSKLAELSLTRSQINKEIKRFKDEKIKTQKRLESSVAERLVRTGALSLEEYEEILRANGFIDRDVAALLTSLEKEQAAADAAPSKTDVLGWAQKGIITDNEFVRLMRVIGHTDLNIQRYAKQIGFRISEDVLQTLTIPESE